MIQDPRCKALLDSLDDAEQRGVHTVAVSSVRVIVREIWEAPPPVDPKHEGAHVSAHYAHQLEAAKFDLATRLEVMKQVFPFAQESMKCVVLMNAGAAAALLAFVGSLVGKNEKATAALLASATLYYMLGVASGALCWGFSYLSQWLYAYRSDDRWGNWVRGFAIGAFVSSIALFVGGGWSAYLVLARIAAS